jgi:hypothetical protein
MNLQELVEYCKQRARWHQAEGERLEKAVNYGQADVNFAKAGVYREVGLRLAAILEAEDE